jgi:hypothetical protein
MVGYEFLLLRVFILVVAYLTFCQLTSLKERSGVFSLLLSIFLLFLIFEDVGVYFEIFREGGFVSAANIVSSLVVVFLMFFMFDFFIKEDDNHPNVVSSTKSYIIMKRVSVYGLFYVGGLSLLLLVAVSFIQIFFYICFTAMWLGPYMHG